MKTRFATLLLLSQLAANIGVGQTAPGIPTIDQYIPHEVNGTPIQLAMLEFRLYDVACDGMGGAIEAIEELCLVKAALGHLIGNYGYCVTYGASYTRVWQRCTTEHPRFERPIPPTYFQPTP